MLLLTPPAPANIAPKLIERLLLAPWGVTAPPPPRAREVPLPTPLPLLLMNAASDEGVIAALLRRRPSPAAALWWCEEG